MVARRRKPMKHQRECLRWAQTRDHIALFLEMRLGKTLVAIRWAEQREGPYLVVCPLSVTYTWKEELRLEGYRSVVLLGSQKQRQEVFLEGIEQGKQWFIVNYEALFISRKKQSTGRSAVQPSWIPKLWWPTVILDESARLRNPQTQTSKVCCEYLSDASNKAVLSGLPNPEGPLDFFQQFKFLNGQFMGHRNFWDYRSVHFQPASYKWFPTRDAMEQIRRAVRGNARVLSRKKVGLANKLIRETRHVFLPEKSRAAYEELESKWASGSVYVKYSVAKFAYLRQTASGFPKNDTLPGHTRKITELLSLLQGELQGQQCVIWYTAKAEGRAIESAVQSKGLGCHRIHGGTLPKKRCRLQQWFAQGLTRTICLQVACGQYGIDLSAASVAIYFSEPTSHDQYAQSLDRIVHPKKTEPLLVISLLAADTLEEDIHFALLKKRLNSRVMLRSITEGIQRRQQKRKHNDV